MGAAGEVLKAHGVTSGGDSCGQTIAFVRITISGGCVSCGSGDFDWYSQFECAKSNTQCLAIGRRVCLLGKHYYDSMRQVALAEIGLPLAPE